MPAEDEAAGAVLAVGCPRLHADAASGHRRALHDGVCRLVLDAALNHSSGELLLLVGSSITRHVTGRRLTLGWTARGTNWDRDDLSMQGADIGS
jgi:hypothetical protein